jgi:hypothetical protein
MNTIPMNLRGMVAHGDKRDRVLGFPTANIAGPIPAIAHGVHAPQPGSPGTRGCGPRSPRTAHGRHSTG